ncbi:MAG: virulence RhuM family protein [Lewinellaceae bacterium]|nr:virulence RhuM family protein [Phaeodactylibacter sp.]MCB9036226.1 virulence RhuM family protein [Lewinellaceae bacterium]
MDSEILIYQTERGNTKIEVILEDETVWLTQNQMMELFQTTKQNISLHIKNIFREGELSENSVVKEYLTTAQDGKNYRTKHFNLDVIISVGYRVKSHRGTQFRIWATQQLKEYLIKGFVLDDERLKSGNQMNYFDELLERIRDIRSSEKIFYQKVKDIYTTSIDYDTNADLTKEFYATVQNKLHWAVHQHTAAELIKKRVSAQKANMGLTTWKGEKIRKSDVTVAKNYLSEDELKQLNLLVEQYLAFAEAQAQAKKPMYMKDWIKKLNDILTINEREILEHAGTVRKRIADEMAAEEYEKYKEKRKLAEKIKSLEELEDEIKLIEKKKKKK